jgi:hypothetical protein
MESLHLFSLLPTDIYPLTSYYLSSNQVLELWNVRSQLKVCSRKVRKIPYQSNVDLVMVGECNILSDQFWYDFDPTAYASPLFDDLDSSRLSNSSDGTNSASTACIDFALSPADHGSPEEPVMFVSGNDEDQCLDFSDDNLRRNADSPRTFDSKNDYPPIYVEQNEASCKDTTDGSANSPHSLAMHRAEELIDPKLRLENPAKEGNPSPKPQAQKRTQQNPPFNSDEDTPIKLPRRNGHTPGINRRTGELTLVGMYPPVLRDNRYYCPDPRCRELNGKETPYTTKNGYKYHLEKSCLQNPHSIRSQKLAAGEIGNRCVRTEAWKRCACGATFKSEIGFRLHKTRNESTKNGRCLEKFRPKIESQRVVNRFSGGKVGCR